ncbi:MAG: endolytic transglycosylase MltG [Actinomycetota bacterium]|nr:endolytic transglycosylase MltG [Actinomycetota bacterium]MDQ3680566.1 endolytic transglycosylase MltG [Actinomycetota bacterium]
MTERGPSFRRRRTVTLAAALVLALLVVGGGGVLWYQRQVDPPGAGAGEVSVEVPEGSSVQRIAGILDDEGVVDSARVFRLYVRSKGSGPFQAGSYRLRRGSSFDELISVLEQGPDVSFDRLTIPEGLTLRQVADRIAKLPGRSVDRFLEVAGSGRVRSRYQPEGSTSLEGLLLPETYHIEDTDDEAVILERMVSAFDDAAARVGIDEVVQGGLVNPYQAVIVASLVEREARRPEDRGPVARVIYNRLKARMPLQVDATVIYAQNRTGEKGLRVLDKDLQVDSPYNTYRVMGLPPTPIAAPGRAALEAAVDPPPGEALFYVTVNDCTGETVFARTGAEHAQNTARRRAENPDQESC